MVREIVREKTKLFEEFAQDWIEGWNAHSIDEIMSHYSDDVVVKSPFLAAVLPESGGTVTGKTRLREIYSNAFKKYPALKFELIKVFASTESVVIHYKTVENMLAAEMFWLDPQIKAKMVLCHYSLA
jgi:hypothetical protein